MFASCSGRCPGVKSLCFVPLGQSQRAEVVCHCHPGPEGPVHPSAHLGSPQRMGKAPWSCSHLGSCVQRLPRSQDCVADQRAGVARWGVAKSRDITLLTNVRLVKAMVFPVVMYGCELDCEEG